jgi:citrate lyase beta subunit
MKLSKDDRRRTVLLSMKADEKLLQANIAARPDVLCVDLEDTAPDKAVARSLAASFHTGGYNGLKGVRINPLTDPEGLKDLNFIREASWCPDVVVLTKVFHPFEITLAEKILPAKCELIVLVETPESIERVNEVAAASSRVSSLMLGGGDLSIYLDCERSWDGLHYCRGRMVVASVAAGLLALDENFRPLDDLAGLAVECRRSRKLGYKGRLTIDPRHVPVIHEIYS